MTFRTLRVPLLLLSAGLAPQGTWLQPIAGAPSMYSQEADPIRELERGLASKDAKLREQAIQAHGPSGNDRAVALIAKALRDKERPVRYMAVETLRHCAHRKALDALHKMLRSDKSLGGDAEMHIALLKAIGQHGNEKSLDLLSSELLVNPDRAVTRAGILAIANIRSRESVETLMSLMRSAGRAQVQRHMSSLRFGLVVLTGTDEGKSQDRWNTWWNDQKRKLKVSPDVPALTEENRRIWNAHWGIQRRRERVLRRHDRGTGDPER